MTPVDVIVPTKSNPRIEVLLEHLLADTGVSQVIVVADGFEAYQRIPVFEGVLIPVDEGDGIHVMWNEGMKYTNQCHHVLFLNDDVTLNESTISGMVATMDRHPELGLCCPNYSGVPFYGDYRPVTDTCRGRYDGTGGLGGFCMLLRNTLAKWWQFDERMKWWYGDDDLLNWVLSQDFRAGICSQSTCSDNESWTIEHDPPANFAAIVAEDRLVFAHKWEGFRARERT